MTSQEARTVLLDLSRLTEESSSPGVARYSEQLALGLGDLSLAARSPLRIAALVALPWLGSAEFTFDLRAAIEEMKSRARSRTGSWASRVRVGLPRAALRARANLVHSPDPGATPWIALSCPRVVTCHHLDSSLDPEVWHGAGSRPRRIDRRRYTRADATIATSRATAQELIARLNVPLDKIHIVYHGVDAGRFSVEPRADDSARLAQFSLETSGYFLCVGSAAERKNAKGILGGFQKAKTLLRARSHKLAWAGKLDRTDAARLQDLAEDLGLQADLCLLGRVSDEDLAALYRGASALVCASHREGFGYPVVEAMASGCPVITSSRSSLAEIAEDAALLVHPDDKAAIADAMVLLSERNAEWHRLRAAGIRRATAFSTARMAEETLSVYEAILREAETPH